MYSIYSSIVGQIWQPLTVYCIHTVVCVCFQLSSNFSASDNFEVILNPGIAVEYWADRPEFVRSLMIIPNKIVENKDYAEQK